MMIHKLGNDMLPIMLSQISRFCQKGVIHNTTDMAVTTPSKKRPQRDKSAQVAITVDMFIFLPP